MQLSNIPARIIAAFANAGSKRTIPVPSQISITPGAASFYDGLPPLNATPLSSGGIPPDIRDMNGILNQITAVQQWQSGGGLFAYDGTWSTANGGYPNGALLLRADGSGYWQCTVDNNTSNPDTGGGGWKSLAGNKSGLGQTLTATGSVTAAAGCVIELNSSSSCTATFPNPTGAAGQEFDVLVTAAGVSSTPTVASATWTIATAAGAFVGDGLNSASTFTVYPLQRFRLISDGTNWLVSGAGSSLGTNQSWTNVTGSRSAGVTYYNTTSKPICVNVFSSHSVSSTTTTLTVNGQLIYGFGDLGTTLGGASACNWIVPPGASYVLGIAGGGSVSISQWLELR